MIGDHCIKAWSKTQSLVAKSSAEAELYATLKAAVESLGMQTLLGELGCEFKVRVYIDSSAAKSIAEREGLDKVRHIDVGILWLQEQEARRQLPLEKVLGTSNPADLMTKHLGQKEVDKYLNMIFVYLASGRASTAPGLHSICSSNVGEKDFWTEHSLLSSFDTLDKRGLPIRVHLKPRSNLFTPLDVAGFPTGRESPGIVRISKGMMLNGKSFEIRDDWTNPNRAHLDIGISWIGTTTFVEES